MGKDKIYGLATSQLCNCEHNMGNYNCAVNFIEIIDYGQDTICMGAYFIPTKKELKMIEAKQKAAPKNGI